MQLILQNITPSILPNSRGHGRIASLRAESAALDSESREANEDDYVRPVTQSDVNGWRRNLGDFAAGRLPFELTVFPYLRRDT